RQTVRQIHKWSQIRDPPLGIYKGEYYNPAFSLFLYGSVSKLCVGTIDTLGRRVSLASGKGIRTLRNIVKLCVQKVSLLRIKSKGSFYLVCWNFFADTMNLKMDRQFVAVNRQFCRNEAVSRKLLSCYFSLECAVSVLPL